MNQLFERFCALQNGETIIDCRTREEFMEGHVPGALLIEHFCLASQCEELKQYSKVYVYCHSGGRASWAVDQLEAQGLTHLVCVVSSGMPDWIAAGHPVTIE